MKNVLLDKGIILPSGEISKDMRQSLRQARATRKLLPPSYPIMRDISALVRKWTDRLTRICRSIIKCAIFFHYCNPKTVVRIAGCP